MVFLMWVDNVCLFNGMVFGEIVLDCIREIRVGELVKVVCEVLFWLLVIVVRLKILMLSCCSFLILFFCLICGVLLCRLWDSFSVLFFLDVKIIKGVGKGFIFEI